MARVRIVNVDFYMNSPVNGIDSMYSEFRGSSVNQVPVVRIFGTSSTGEKTCLHVHGVFPYIYVPYDGQHLANNLMYQVASGLDKAINVYLGQASSNVHHVHKISLVSGRPFYGYHEKEHQFFKIYFYNPLIIRKACTLLESGNILGRIFQPHEAHIPYILQFMIDYNLHGMSFIDLSHVRYRFGSHIGSDVPPDLILPPTLRRQSTCKVEADAQAEHILNRLDVADGKLSVNPGIKSLWEDEKQRRRNKNEDSQILPCLTQARVNVPVTATHIAFKNLLEEKVSVAVNKPDTARDLNLSVYPAETPSSQSLLNASAVENHTPSSQNSDSTTLEDTLNENGCNTDAALEHSFFLEEEAQNLLGLLKDLRENVEKDSILSQVHKEQNSEEEEEEEMDLSLPLASLQTPRKDDVEDRSEQKGSDDEFNDSYFDATLCIPQLDGNSDVETTGKSRRHRAKSPSCRERGHDVLYKYNLRSLPSRERSMIERSKALKEAVEDPVAEGKIGVRLGEPRIDISNQTKFRQSANPNSKLQSDCGGSNFRQHLRSETSKVDTVESGFPIITSASDLQTKVELNSNPRSSFESLSNVDIIQNFTSKPNIRDLACNETAASVLKCTSKGEIGEDFLNFGDYPVNNEITFLKNKISNKMTNENGIDFQCARQGTARSKIEVSENKATNEAFAPGVSETNSKDTFNFEDQIETAVNTRTGTKSTQKVAKNKSRRTKRPIHGPTKNKVDISEIVQETRKLGRPRKKNEPRVNQSVTQRGKYLRVGLLHGFKNLATPDNLSVTSYECVAKTGTAAHNPNLLSGEERNVERTPDLSDLRSLGSFAKSEDIPGTNNNAGLKGEDSRSSIASAVTALNNRISNNMKDLELKSHSSKRCPMGDLQMNLGGLQTSEQFSNSGSVNLGNRCDILQGALNDAVKELHARESELIRSNKVHINSQKHMHSVQPVLKVTKSRGKKTKVNNGNEGTSHKEDAKVWRPRKARIHSSVSEEENNPRVLGYPKIDSEIFSSDTGLKKEKISHDVLGNDTALEKPISNKSSDSIGSESKSHGLESTCTSKPPPVFRCRNSSIKIRNCDEGLDAKNSSPVLGHATALEDQICTNINDPTSSESKLLGLTSNPPQVLGYQKNNCLVDLLIRQYQQELSNYNTSIEPISVSPGLRDNPNFVELAKEKEKNAKPNAAEGLSRVKKRRAGRSRKITENVGRNKKGLSERNIPSVNFNCNVSNSDDAFGTNANDSISLESKSQDYPSNNLKIKKPKAERMKLMGSNSLVNRNVNVYSVTPISVERLHFSEHTKREGKSQMIRNDELENSERQTCCVTNQSCTCTSELKNCSNYSSGDIVAKELRVQNVEEASKLPDLHSELNCLEPIKGVGELEGDSHMTKNPSRLKKATSIKVSIAIERDVKTVQMNKCDGVSLSGKRRGQSRKTSVRCTAGQNLNADISSNANASNGSKYVFENSEGKILLDHINSHDSKSNSSVGSSTLNIPAKVAVPKLIQTAPQVPLKNDASSSAVCEDHSSLRYVEVNAQTALPKLTHDEPTTKRKKIGDAVNVNKKRSGLRKTGIGDNGSKYVFENSGAKILCTHSNSQDSQSYNSEGGSTLKIPEKVAEPKLIQTAPQLPLKNDASSSSACEDYANLRNVEVKAQTALPKLTPDENTTKRKTVGGGVNVNKKRNGLRKTGIGDNGSKYVFEDSGAKILCIHSNSHDSQSYNSEGGSTLNIPEKVAIPKLIQTAPQLPLKNDASSSSVCEDHSNLRYVEVKAQSALPKLTHDESTTKRKKVGGAVNVNKKRNGPRKTGSGDNGSRCVLENSGAKILCIHSNSHDSQSYNSEGGSTIKIPEKVAIPKLIRTAPQLPLKNDASSSSACEDYANLRNVEVKAQTALPKLTPDENTTKRKTVGGGVNVNKKRNGLRQTGIGDNGSKYVFEDSGAKILCIHSNSHDSQSYNSEGGSTLNIPEKVAIPKLIQTAPQLPLKNDASSSSVCEDHSNLRYVEVKAQSALPKLTHDESTTKRKKVGGAVNVNKKRNGPRKTGSGDNGSRCVLENSGAKILYIHSNSHDSQSYNSEGGSTIKIPEKVAIPKLIRTAPHLPLKNDASSSAVCEDHSNLSNVEVKAQTALPKLTHDETTTKRKKVGGAVNVNKKRNELRKTGIGDNGSRCVLENSGAKILCIHSNSHDSQSYNSEGGSTIKIPEKVAIPKLIRTAPQLPLKNDASSSSVCEDHSNLRYVEVKAQTALPKLTHDETTTKRKKVGSAVNVNKKRNELRKTGIGDNGSRCVLENSGAKILGVHSNSHDSQSYNSEGGSTIKIPEKVAIPKLIRTAPQLPLKNDASSSSVCEDHSNLRYVEVKAQTALPKLTHDEPTTRRKKVGGAVNVNKKRNGPRKTGSGDNGSRCVFENSGAKILCIHSNSRDPQSYNSEGGSTLKIPEKVAIPKLIQTAPQLPLKNDASSSSACEDRANLRNVEVKLQTALPKLTRDETTTKGKKVGGVNVNKKRNGFRKTGSGDNGSQYVFENFGAKILCIHRNSHDSQSYNSKGGSALKIPEKVAIPKLIQTAPQVPLKNDASSSSACEDCTNLRDVEVKAQTALPKLTHDETTTKRNTVGDAVNINKKRNGLRNTDIGDHIKQTEESLEDGSESPGFENQVLNCSNDLNSKSRKNDSGCLVAKSKASEIGSDMDLRNIGSSSWNGRSSCAVQDLVSKSTVESSEFHNETTKQQYIKVNVMENKKTPSRSRKIVKRNNFPIRKVKVADDEILITIPKISDTLKGKGRVKVAKNKSGKQVLRQNLPTLLKDKVEPTDSGSAPIKPKFVIVPARKPYDYPRSPNRREPKSKCSPFRKLLRKFPNTDWSVCQSSDTVCQSPSSSRRSICVISDRKLSDDEKFSVSQFPVQKSNVTMISSEANSLKENVNRASAGCEYVENAEARNMPDLNLEGGYEDGANMETKRRLNSNDGFEDDEKIRDEQVEHYDDLYTSNVLSELYDEIEEYACKHLSLKQRDVLLTPEYEYQKFKTADYGMAPPVPVEKFSAVDLNGNIIQDAIDLSQAKGNCKTSPFDESFHAECSGERIVQNYEETDELLLVESLKGLTLSDAGNCNAFSCSGLMRGATLMHSNNPFKAHNSKTFNSFSSGSRGVEMKAELREVITKRTKTSSLCTAWDVTENKYACTIFIDGMNGQACGYSNVSAKLETSVAALKFSGSTSDCNVHPAPYQTFKSDASPSTANVNSGPSLKKLKKKRPSISNIGSASSAVNFVGKLTRLAVRRRLPHPRYISGGIKPLNKYIVRCAFLNCRSRGVGKTKFKARQSAARGMLRLLSFKGGVKSSPPLAASLNFEEFEREHRTTSSSEDVSVNLQTVSQELKTCADEVCEYEKDCVYRYRARFDDLERRRCEFSRGTKNHHGHGESFGNVEVTSYHSNTSAPMNVTPNIQDISSEQRTCVDEVFDCDEDRESVDIKAPYYPKKEPGSFAGTTPDIQEESVNTSATPSSFKPRVYCQEVESRANDVSNRIEQTPRVQNYLQDLNEEYDSILKRQEKSLTQFYDSLQPVMENGCISFRLLLQQIQIRENERRRGILANGRPKKIGKRVKFNEIVQLDHLSPNSNLLSYENATTKIRDDDSSGNSSQKGFETLRGDNSFDSSGDAEIYGWKQSSDGGCKFENEDASSSASRDSFENATFDDDVSLDSGEDVEMCQQNSNRQFQQYVEDLPSSSSPEGAENFTTSDGEEADARSDSELDDNYHIAQTTVVSVNTASNRYEFEGGKTFLPADCDKSCPDVRDDFDLSYDYEERNDEDDVSFESELDARISDSDVDDICSSGKINKSCLDMRNYFDLSSDYGERKDGDDVSLESELDARISDYHADETCSSGRINSLHRGQTKVAASYHNSNRDERRQNGPLFFRGDCDENYSEVEECNSDLPYENYRAETAFSDTHAREDECCIFCNDRVKRQGKKFPRRLKLKRFWKDDNGDKVNDIRKIADKNRCTTSEESNFGFQNHLPNCVPSSRDVENVTRLRTQNCTENVVDETHIRQYRHLDATDASSSDKTILSRTKHFDDNRQCQYLDGTNDSPLERRIPNCNKCFYDGNRVDKCRCLNGTHDDSSEVQRLNCAKLLIDETHVDQYRYLDGTNDSSSEDDVRPDRAKRSRVRSPRKVTYQPSRYTPLAVKVCSPSKSSRFMETDQSFQDQLNEISANSLSNEDKNEASLNLSQKSAQHTKQKSFTHIENTGDNSPAKYKKRKLTFSEIGATPLDKTLVEEVLTCRYKSPSQKGKHTVEVNDIPTANIRKKCAPVLFDEVDVKASEESACVNRTDTKPSDVRNLFNINDDVDCFELDRTFQQSGCKKLSSEANCRISDTDSTERIATQTVDAGSEKTSQNSTRSHHLSDDIFSPGNNADFVIHEIDEENCDSSGSDHNITVVERYDQEDSSKLLFDTRANSDLQNSDVSRMINSRQNSSSTSDQVTPYQRETATVFSPSSSSCDFVKYDLKKHLTVYEHSNPNATFCSDGLMASAPKYNPPVREFIISTLPDYNIPQMRHEEPFYSDCNDVTGNVEVGHNVLKIPSKTVSDLLEFEARTVGIEHYRRQALESLAPSNERLTNREISNYKLAFCKDGDCVIVPIVRPPARREVEMWFESRLAVKSEVTAKKERVRIRIPRSPGAKDDEDSCDSLSISPCTPSHMKLAKLKRSDEVTPRSDEVTPRNDEVTTRNDEVTYRNDEVTSRSDEVIYRSDEVTSRNDEVTSVERLKENDGLFKDSPVIKRNNVLRRCKKRLAKRRLSSSFNDSPEDKPEETLKEIAADGEPKTLLQADTHQKENEISTHSCQITGITLDNTHNFAMSFDDLQKVKTISEHQFLTVLSMEVHVQTRGDFKPNPELDPIRAIFYSVSRDAPGNPTSSGAFIVDCLPHSPSKRKLSAIDGIGVNCDAKCFDSELNLINGFVGYVKDCDPEILVGYEIELSSWGYLVDRGYVLGLNLISLLSRVPADVRHVEEKRSELKLPGRIIIDFWRLMRHEVALQSYTFENIVYHILHQRVPLYSDKDLSFWWNHPTALYRHRTITHFLFRVEAVLKLMERLDLIGRTSELARLFGIQFFEVLSRGSQFRVESMMLRLAKPLNYIPVSPSVQQRARMRAPESLPLIMEPESKFYVDPVIVLDFQSLYPSMIIAYNYCFSTCLGRIEHLGQNCPFEFGATQLKVPRKCVNKLLTRDKLNFSPCGVAFVTSALRRGILPRMLQEILDTRLMVKKSMKENSDDKTVQKVLHARQLGLKLIANVTYGYTAANFSGRMPAVEVADSVVSKGRETLQRAIKLVENSKWGARVVYGDTDSLFVLVAGRSREEAFEIGAEIAEAVTNDNPSPIKLKLEKVFQPCILQTKKRYVGYMYESADQGEPEFCAKGIETVRRDGCPAASKMLEKCLKMLFNTRDVSLIRKYVVRQFSKLLSGRVSIQDLTFAKEYRGLSGYRPSACVPALELARKWTAVDKRNEPRRGERVPYVIINGPPSLPLIRLVRSPRELLSDSSLRANALYYITKVIIPPINRCLNLIGADLNTWFNNMPRRQIQYLPSSSPTKFKKSTISQYFSTASCALCGQQTCDGLCASCMSKPQESAVLLHQKVHTWERNHYETCLICQSCCGRPEVIACISLDCPVLYRRTQTEKDLQQSPFVRQLISTLPQLDF